MHQRFGLNNTVLCDSSIYRQPFICSHASQFFGIDVFSLGSLLDQLQQYLKTETTPT